MSSRALALLACPLLLACGDANECAGSTSGGACVEVLSVMPTYAPWGARVSTDNVDVVQGTCAVRDASTGQLTAVPEYFGDHDVIASVANVPDVQNAPQAPAESPAVTLENYRIQFTVQDCPNHATCPRLDEIEISPGDTVTIAANSTAQFTLPLMPLRTKLEYVAKGGSTDAYPMYVAHYTMTGPTPVGGESSTRVEAWVDFTIGDFSECPTP